MFPEMVVYLGKSKILTIVDVVEGVLYAKDETVEEKSLTNCLVKSAGNASTGYTVQDIVEKHNDEARNKYGSEGLLEPNKVTEMYYLDSDGEPTKFNSLDGEYSYPEEDKRIKVKRLFS